MEENKILNEKSSRPWKTYSTVDHMFVLKSLIDLMQYKKKKLYCVFIDYAKAFDSVWRKGLWFKMENVG